MGDLVLFFGYYVFYSWHLFGNINLICYVCRVLKNKEIMRQHEFNPDDLLQWDNPIYNTLEQKSMTRDITKLKNLRDEKS